MRCYHGHSGGSPGPKRGRDGGGREGERERKREERERKILNLMAHKYLIVHVHVQCIDPSIGMHTKS
jgi:hypothetical protein